MAILVKNLKKKVLENAKESDQIIIITGYFSPDMIDEIAKMGVPFVYYYGMYIQNNFRMVMIQQKEVGLYWESI